MSQTDISLTEFETIVHTTMGKLPAWVRDRLHDINVLVVDDPRQVADTQGEDLLGLYVGLPLTERDANYFGELPDIIYIFRRPHLDLGLAPQALREEVARTLIHEIAHYFGIDDDHLDEIGWG
jgi:predicted Zn-dependent protease with MMP-like domain